MFSGPEFLLIFLIMLIVLGPVRMAEVAKKVGKFIGYARRTASNLQYQLEDELELKKIREQLPTRVDLESSLGIDELKKDVNKLKQPLVDSKGAPTDTSSGHDSTDPVSTETDIETASDAEPQAAPADSKTKDAES
ncbi:MAG: twin-arginine translocase TatA/TatE family subunit [Pseudomonadota bacterium]